MDPLNLSLLVICTLVSSAITFFFFFFFFKRQPPPKPVIAGTTIKPYPIIGNLPHFVKNRARFLDWITELLSASPTGTVTVAPFVFTADPAVVEHTARSHFTSYPKGPAFTTALLDLLGHGIFTSNGDSWRLQRTTASSEFNTRAFRTFVLEAVRRELDTRLIPLFADSSRTGSVLDLQDLLQRFALDNICNVVFNADPACLGGDEEGDRFYCAFEDASHLIIARWSYPFHWMWKLKRWLDAGSERQLRSSIKIVQASILKFMRRSQSGLLSRFVESGVHSEGSMLGILVNIMSAGRDTTPAALSWFFWVLSSAPEVTNKIVEEITSVRSNSEGAVLTLEEVRGMHYLHAALTESMRLHPPVPMMPRECVVEQVLPDGTMVRKGWTVMYSAYAMGRAEKVWGEGWAEFKPERWLEEGVFKAESSFMYTVFHAGPRVCLGKEMAYIQMKMVAAAVIERFEVEVVEERGEREVGMSLRIAGGLPVKFKERIKLRTFV